jgi:hypothetical protein
VWCVFRIVANNKNVGSPTLDITVTNAALDLRYDEICSSVKTYGGVIDAAVTEIDIWMAVKKQEVLDEQRLVCPSWARDKNRA